MTVQTESLAGIDLLAEIDRLRKERNAVILAHYYQKPEIQDLADFVGDSLELSRKAAATDAQVIAFCGVKFMADTAKILSPEKIVVLPDMEAGCSLEDSCPPEKFAAFRARHPDHIGVRLCRLAAQLQRIAHEISQVLQFRALVVVGQDHRVALLAQAVDLGLDVDVGVHRLAIGDRSGQRHRGNGGFGAHGCSGGRPRGAAVGCEGSGESWRSGGRSPRSNGPPGRTSPAIFTRCGVTSSTVT